MTSVPPHVRLAPPPEALAWVRDSIGPAARIVGVRPLLRSRWHANHVVRVVGADGSLRELVLRRWARPGWDIVDPDFDAAREAAVLRVAERIDVPTPTLIAVDPEPRSCDVPALLMSRLDGRPPGAVTDLSGFLEQLAAALHAIHLVEDDAARALPRYRSWHEPGSMRPPPWIPRGGPWAEAFRVVTQAPPAAAESFIHRDYHPGNTLWARRQLVGVVDWTTGSWGPRAVDVAHMRWNLALDRGADAAARFLDVYRQLSPVAYRHDPYWDVLDLLDRFGDDVPDDPPPSRVELDRLTAYLLAALEGR